MLNNSKNILITGASGWLGKRVIRMILAEENFFKNYLGENFIIKCFIKKNENFILNNQRILIFNGDLKNNIDICKFFEKERNYIFIHLAGVIHPKFFTKDFWDINVNSAETINNILIKQECDKAIIVSSNSPFGANQNNQPFDENSPYRPYMKYGRSKMLMEKIFKKNKKAIILRAPWFYGPGQPKRQNDFYKMVIKGIFPIFNKGKNIRSMVHVDNLAYAVFKAIQLVNTEIRIFWISDSNNYSFNEIIEIIKHVYRDKPGFSVSNKNLYLPNFISNFARLADYVLQSLGFYNQKIHVLSECNLDIFCDISLAKKVLHFQPKFSLKDGVEQIFILDEYDN
jgi:nucleoside-diphosphate-sugar epimerase